MMHKIGVNRMLGYSADGIPFPARIICPSCRIEITTYIKIQPGVNTWICCLFLGVTIGCCCIPFFIQDCNDKIHFCPNCHVKVGRKEYRIC